MPRKYLRKVLPGTDLIKRIWGISWVEHWLRNENLWHINKRSVSLGVAVGLFFAYLPIPVQSLLAACAAIFVHANLPISIILVWISNPLTYLFLYTPAYMLGSWLLGEGTGNSDQLDLAFLGQNLEALWLGCFVIGTVLALLGWLLVRLYWYWHVRNSWQERKRRRNLRRF